MAIVINGSGTITGVSVGGLPDGSVDDDTLATGIDATKLTGTIADARISAGSVAQHVDLTAIRADISALALREATNENSAAFNLPNSFIETFTDDTNLGTQITCDRISGYMETQVSTADPNCQLLLHMEDTALTDSSDTDHTPTITGSAARSSTQAKFGTYSCYYANNADDSIEFPSSSDWQFGTGDATVEFWAYHTGTSGEQFYVTTYTGSAGFGIRIIDSNGYLNTNTSGGGWTGSGYFTHGMSTGQWYHWAIVWEGGATIKAYINGVLKNTWTVAYINDTTGTLYIGGQTGTSPNGYMDEVRISKGLARYTAAFTPPTSALSGYTTSINATGTLIQSANVVGSAKTEVSGTIIYKDNAGTAALGTDLKIYFTCNGDAGSPAWTEAASYNAITPVYATGIKQVRLGKTTCTSGTDIRYKVVWANQAASSKETQLHGIGINY